MSAKSTPPYHLECFLLTTFHSLRSFSRRLKLQTWIIHLNTSASSINRDLCVLNGSLNAASSQRFAWCLFWLDGNGFLKHSSISHFCRNEKQMLITPRETGRLIFKNVWHSFMCINYGDDVRKAKDLTIFNALFEDSDSKI